MHEKEEAKFKASLLLSSEKIFKTLKAMLKVKTPL
jgi:hypothetical protein